MDSYQLPPGREKGVPSQCLSQSSYSPLPTKGEGGAATTHVGRRGNLLPPSNNSSAYFRGGGGDNRITEGGKPCIIYGAFGTFCTSFSFLARFVLKAGKDLPINEKPICKMPNKKRWCKDICERTVNLKLFGGASFSGGDKLLFSLSFQPNFGPQLQLSRAFGKPREEERGMVVIWWSSPIWLTGRS